MLIGASLNASEFKDLHNAKCELYQIVGRLERSGLVSKNLVKELSKVKRAISKSLQNAYKKETKIMDERAAVYNAAAKANNLESTWSLYEVENMMLPHPYKNVSKVVHKNHWGKTAVAVEIEGDRWIDLYVAADKAIKLSDDTHHSFIEGFAVNPDDSSELILSTGS